MKTVFVDVDTQFDFVFPAGALYVPGAERLVEVFARLNQRAAGSGCVVVSTTDAHSENDEEFRTWPPHCVAGTMGQRKPAGALLDRRISIASTKPLMPVAGAAQVLVEKQRLDCFTNENLPGLLSELAADRYVVYGVVTEYCVRCAVMGLLKTGRRVELVEDAIQTLNSEAAARTLAEFTAGGGVLTRSAAILA